MKSKPPIENRSSRSPIILLSCTELTADGPAGDPSLQKPHHNADPDSSLCRRDGLLMSYVRSVSAAGGVPLLLPNVPRPEVVAAAMAAADGLLLSGGCDVDASLYGRSAHQTMSAPDVDRDTTERLAITEAMRQCKPILGICRGIQILNVALGGSLIQDIPSHHRQAGTSDPLGHSNNVRHGVKVERSSIVAELWGSPSFEVNSSHHQAVDALAGGLKITARATDGIVEAVESADAYPLLAVQCHPERLAHRDERFAAVFKWLVKAATSSSGNA